MNKSSIPRAGKTLRVSWMSISEVRHFGAVTAIARRYQDEDLTPSSELAIASYVVSGMPINHPLMGLRYLQSSVHYRSPSLEACSKDTPNIG